MTATPHAPPPPDTAADTAPTEVRPSAGLVADRSLPDFFGDLALLLNHGRKRHIVPTTEAPDAETRVVLGPILSWPFALALVGVLALASVPLFRGTGEPVPEGLLGRWTTEDPRYAGRSLEITPTAVRIGLDSAPAGAAHPITFVTVRRAPQATFVTFEYREEGEAHTLALTYLPPPFGTFTLKHPAEAVWRKGGPAATRESTPPSGAAAGRPAP